MNASAIYCNGCRKPLFAEGFFNSTEPVNCPDCAAPLQVWVFPAFFQPAIQGRTGETALLEGEATCYYHSDKKAAVPCGRCGRFLCSLCDLEMSGEHLCSNCLELGHEKKTLKKIETQQNRYDSIALAVALLPILFWPVTLFSAPTALFLSIRYWKTPGGLVHHSKIQFVFAIIFSLLQMGAWLALLFFILSR